MISTNHFTFNSVELTFALIDEKHHPYQYQPEPHGMKRLHRLPDQGSHTRRSQENGGKTGLFPDRFQATIFVRVLTICICEIDLAAMQSHGMMRLGLILAGMMLCVYQCEGEFN